MFEKRLTDRLVNYWNSLKKDEKLPHIKTFRTEVVQDVWDNCFQIVVRIGSQENKTYVYEYVGKEISKAFGKDTKQNTSPDLQNVPEKRIIDKISQVTKKNGAYIRRRKFYK